MVLLFVVVQVVFSQSRTVRGAWVGATRRMPDPVLAAGEAVADTPVGRGVGYVAEGIHAGANWLFRPFRTMVAAQEQRGRDAAAAAAEFRRRVEELENTRPPGPQRVIGEPIDQ